MLRCLRAMVLFRRALVAGRCAAHLPSAAPCPRNRRVRSRGAWMRFPEKASPQFRPARTDNNALPNAWDPLEASGPAELRTEVPRSRAALIESGAEIGARQRQDRTLRKAECSTEQRHFQPSRALQDFRPRRFPRRSEIGSAAPDAETPIGPKPSRPRSCTVVSSPGAWT